MDNNTLESRLDFIEFRQELLFNNTEVDHSLFENKVTRNQYQEVLNLMDEYRDLIESNNKVNHHGFEQKIYDIVPQCNTGYHFVEWLVQAFHKTGRYEEVFETLYGKMPKYQSYMNQ